MNPKRPHIRTRSYPFVPALMHGTLEKCTQRGDVRTRPYRARPAFVPARTVQEMPGSLEKTVQKQKALNPKPPNIRTRSYPFVPALMHGTLEKCTQRGDVRTRSYRVRPAFVPTRTVQEMPGSLEKTVSETKGHEPKAPERSYPFVPVRTGADARKPRKMYSTR